MSRLRAIPGGRERRETAEHALDAVKTRAIDALCAAGLSTEAACMAVHLLCSGAPDAFARAYTYVSALGIDAAAFRGWAITHGFAHVVGAQLAPNKITLADIKREYEAAASGQED